MLRRLSAIGERRRATVLVAVVVMSVAAVGTFFGVQKLSAEAPLTLPTLSGQDLDAFGITLSQPPAGNFPVSREDAIAAAQLAFPGGQVVDVRVVHTVNSHRRPVVDAVCWAVSSVGNTPPSFGPRGAPRPPSAKYLVVFVDATTGAVRDAVAH